MNIVESIAGEICKILLPINEKIFFGNSKSSVVICTLSSMKLLVDIANSSLISKISLAGRLLSENKGIDSLVKHVISNKKIKTILVCGKDSIGHRAGHSLLNLYENGIDAHGKIIGSHSPEPVVTLTQHQIETFQEQVKIINQIGQTDMSKIKHLVGSIKI